MTFLELCRALRNRAPGIGGVSGQPTSVLSQTGDMANVVDWIREAWIDIQASQQDWGFLRAEFSSNLPANTQEAAPTAMGVADLSAWHTDTLRAYLTATGTADEQHLVEWPYGTFRDTYQFGSQTPGRPVTFAVRPRDKALLFGPRMGEAYTVTGEYQRRPQIFSANADVPIGLPDEYHMLIVCWAMTKHAGFEAAPEILVDARNQMGKLMGRLKNDWLPAVGHGESLA